MPVIDAFHKLIFQHSTGFIGLCEFVVDAGTVEAKKFTLLANRQPIISLEQSPAV
ncbi:hypothetical protein [Selenomonas sp. WCT3]|uniref:hypothetical protein n=1 Tax=Selenomonas sp. WCT3 TaxID=3158785 RepID=UPI0015D66EC1